MVVLSLMCMFVLQHMATLRELRLKKCIELPAHSIKQMFRSKCLSQLAMLDLTECSPMDDECVILINKWYSISVDKSILKVLLFSFKHR